MQSFEYTGYDIVINLMERFFSFRRDMSEDINKLPRSNHISDISPPKSEDAINPIQQIILEEQAKLSSSKKTGESKEGEHIKVVD